MNPLWIGKGKFLIHHYLDPKPKGQLSDTENSPIGKMDNVKSSVERQVKAPVPFFYEKYFMGTLTAWPVVPHHLAWPANQLGELA